MLSTAIILAGGLGTRLREVVQDRPKPMALVNGLPFLARQISYWISQGIDNFVLSVGYKHEIIIDFFGYEYLGAKIDYAVETRPLGTGGGLFLAMEKIASTSPFLLLNGDTYFTVELSELVNFSEASSADLTFALFSTADTKRYMGIDVSSSGEVTALKSNAINKSHHLANGGVYLVSNPLALKDNLYDFTKMISFEDEVLPNMHTTGKRLFGLVCEGVFIDIGLPEDYKRSESVLFA